MRWVMGSGCMACIERHAPSLSELILALLRFTMSRLYEFPLSALEGLSETFKLHCYGLHGDFTT